MCVYNRWQYHNGSLAVSVVLGSLNGLSVSHMLLPLLLDEVQSGVLHQCTITMYTRMILCSRGGSNRKLFKLLANLCVYLYLV